MADLTEIKDLEGKVATIQNDWQVLQQQRNGLTVRRKYKGFSTSTDINNSVPEVIIYYFEQELYPNHTEENPSIAKTLHKSYFLKNIGKRIKIDTNFATQPDEQDIITEEEIRDVINTLDIYINEIGQPGIVNAVNSTLINLEKLPLDSPDLYTLNSK
jgi:hypothetical protein